SSEPPSAACSDAPLRLDHASDQPPRPCRALDLFEGTLPRRLVWPPPLEPGAVPESVAGDVIVAHLHDQFVPQRLPFARAFARPAARSARRAAGKAGRPLERLQPPGQFGPLCGMDG